MSDVDAYLGEIRYFGGTFAPRGWCFCNGTLLQISEFPALYSIIGTIYGGDGRVTFAAPDMRGRYACGAGQGPALSYRPLGARFGDEYVMIGSAQMPSHTHAVSSYNPTLTRVAVAAQGTVQDPIAGMKYAEGYYPARPVGIDRYQTNSSSVPTHTLGGASTSGQGQTDPAGSGQYTTNMAPYQVINAIMCVDGLFPSRN